MSTMPSGSTRLILTFLYSFPSIVLKSSARTTEAENRIKKVRIFILPFLLSFALDREPRRIEVRERLFQLFQLCRRTVHFQPGEIAHREHFREQIPDVVEVRENTFGVGISFTAENFVAVNRKRIEKILFLGPGFLDKTREHGFDRLQFPRSRFEIWMQADES